MTGSASADPIEVKLYLSDVNEAPSFSDDTVSVPELLGYADLNDETFTPTSVTNLDAADPEGDPKSFSILSGDDSNIFQVVNPSDGSTPFLQLSSPLNAEVKSQYVLNMQVVDIPGAGKDPR